MTDRFSGPKRANGTSDGWFLGAVFEPVSKSIPPELKANADANAKIADMARVAGAFELLGMGRFAGNVHGP